MAEQNPGKVIYRQVGKSGLRVSVPILGAMHFGEEKERTWKLAEKDAMQLLKAAFERGINTWDTANIYSDGKSEEIIGKAIKEFDIPRTQVVIMTKCYFAVKNIDANQGNYVNQHGLSRQAIFNAVEASLKRLDTGYIDVLQIHRFDEDTPIEETMKALHDLVQIGKVRYIGASSMRAVQFATMQSCAQRNGWTKFISMQNKYNLLYREEEREMNHYCYEAGVGLIPWAPLDTGRLAKPVSWHQQTTRSKDIPPLSQADQAIISRVEQLAKNKGWSMSQVALAWLNPLICSPIVGLSSIERLEETLQVNSKSLTVEEIDWLEELYHPRAVDGFDVSETTKHRRALQIPRLTMDL